MDKIMSPRMDEAVIQRIGMSAKKLGTSKKAVLENAIRHYAGCGCTAGLEKMTPLEVK
jgi:hypothetical protein